MTDTAEQSPWAIDGVEPIGIVIAQFRGQWLNQEEAAEQMGVGRSSLQRWELLLCVPQPGVARKVGEVLGLANGELADALRAQQVAVKARRAKGNRGS